MIIRLLLIAAVLGAALVALRSSRSMRQRALQRLALLGFTAAWVVAVLVPDVTTQAAQAVGVGRGADLLLYGLAVAMVLLVVTVHRRFEDLDRRLERLTRELALHTASRRPDHDEASAR